MVPDPVPVLTCFCIYSVICHDTILASSVDTTLPLATRRSCYMALDALGGDPEFLDRVCDCRAVLQAQREQRHARSNSTTTKPDGLSADLSEPSGSASVSDDIEMDYGEEGEVLQGVADADEQDDDDEVELEVGDETSMLID